MNKEHLVTTACPLCGSTADSDFDVILEANFSPEHINAHVFSARRLPDRVRYRMVKCKHDGLVRSHPILSNEIVAGLYSDSHVDYDQEISLLQKTYLRALEPVLSQVEKTAAILEIGSGNGFILEALQKKGFANLVGVEPGTKAVDKAKESVRPLLRSGLFSKKMFGDQKFNIICCFQTLDHIPDINVFMQDVYELLETGGFFVSYHHDINHWSVKILGDRHPIFDIEHTFLYDHDTTQAICYRNGLLVQHIFSPKNILSLKHFLRLIPLPASLKHFLIDGPLARTLAKVQLNVKLGNICVIAQKPGLHLTTKTPSTWNKIQKELRKSILDISFAAQLSHIGSCLCAVDIIEAVYQSKKKQDVFILSNGHAGVAWYAVLEKHGHLTRKQTQKLCIHPDRNEKLSIPVSTGSLGQGLPIAVGMALADKQRQVYCLISDGELAEGSIWESLRIAKEQELTNLHVIISANGWAGYRPVLIDEIQNQLEGFGYTVIEIDGHTVAGIKQALVDKKKNTGPSILMALTQVEQFDFLQGQDAHYYVMAKSDYQKALEKLE